MSDFRKLGPAVVDADRVRSVHPAHEAYPETGIWVNYADGETDFVKIDGNIDVDSNDLIKGAINEFYRPYNPPGAVTYEPKIADDDPRWVYKNGVKVGFEGFEEKK